MRKNGDGSNTSNSAQGPDAMERRISGYCNTVSQKVWWDRQLERARSLESLSKGCGLGVLFSWIAEFDIPLDRESLKALKRILTDESEEPAELTHKPARSEVARRAREARTKTRSAPAPA